MQFVFDASAFAAAQAERERAEDATLAEEAEQTLARMEAAGFSVSNPFASPPPAAPAPTPAPATQQPAPWAAGVLQEQQPAPPEPKRAGRPRSQPALPDETPEDYRRRMNALYVRRSRLRARGVEDSPELFALQEAHRKASEQERAAAAVWSAARAKQTEAKRALDEYVSDRV